MYENSFTLKKMLAAYWKPLRFAGRSTRTELLGYLIVSWLAATAFGWLSIGMGMASIDQTRFGSLDIVNLLFWLPFPALAVRRFHDQDKPAWWATPLILSTVLSWIGGFNLLSQAIQIILAAVYIAALVLLFWKPTDGPNRYGPDPRLDPETASEELPVL